MEYVAIIMAFVAAAMGAYTSVQSGKAQNRMILAQAEANRRRNETIAKQYENEVKWAEYNMEVKKRQAEEDKRLAKREYLVQRSKAAVAHGGIEETSGSLLDEEIRELELFGYRLEMMDWDTSLQLTNLEKQKAGYMTQISATRGASGMETSIAEFQAENVETQAGWAAGGSLLTGASKAAGYYADASDYNRYRAYRWGGNEQGF